MSFLYFKLVHLPLFVAVYWKHDCVTCVCVYLKGVISFLERLM